MFRKLTAVIIGSLFPVAAHAQYHLGDSGWDCTGFLFCGSSGNAVTILSSHLITTVLVFIAPLAVVVFLYGAIRMASSQGQEGKEAGKKAIIWASLGLVAALLTGAVVAFVRDYIYFLGS